MKKTPELPIQRSAVISPCEQYRYELRRVWEPEKGVICFIGLNPSIADAEQDDPTVRRCIAFARSWGYGGLVMVNLFAIRLTDSSRLQFAPSPSPPENWRWVKEAALACDIVVGAWGSHKMARLQSAALLENLAGTSIELQCIKQTQLGIPWHPLYLRGDLKPQVLSFPPPSF